MPLYGPNMQINRLYLSNTRKICMKYARNMFKYAVNMQLYALIMQVCANKMPEICKNYAIM